MGRTSRWWRPARDRWKAGDEGTDGLLHGRLRRARVQLAWPVAGAVRADAPGVLPRRVLRRQPLQGRGVSPALRVRTQLRQPAGDAPDRAAKCSRARRARFALLRT